MSDGGYVRIQVYLDPAKRLTKLDLISYTYAMQLKATPCDFTCNKCGLHMLNEFDFAAHYTVDDPRYPNLGHCPVPSAAELTKVIDDSRTFSSIDEGDTGTYI